MLGWWGFHAYYEGQVQTAGRAIPKIIWRTDILTKKILPPFQPLQAWQKQLLRRREVQNVVKSIIEDNMERKFVYFIIKGITSLRHFEIHTNCVFDNYISFVMSSVMWAWQLAGNWNLVGNGIGFWFWKCQPKYLWKR